MYNSGTLSCHDHPDFLLFSGSIGPGADGTGLFIDSTDLSLFTGIVISDSTRIYPDMTFTQYQVLGPGPSPWWIFPDDPVMPVQPSTTQPSTDPNIAWAFGGDPPMYFTDRTYAHGTLGIDGTYRDGTYMRYWYDPIWVNFSLWYTQNGNNELIGYRYQEPIRINVGNYYTSMVVPRETGHYEIRWRYQKDNSSYARERVQGFWCQSAGIDPDRT